MIVSHRSRVFYTRFQIKNKKRTNLEKKEPKERKNPKKKEDRRRREEPTEDLKKEQRDAG